VNVAFFRAVIGLELFVEGGEVGVKEID